MVSMKAHAAVLLVVFVPCNASTTVDEPAMYTGYFMVMVYDVDMFVRTYVRVFGRVLYLLCQSHAQVFPRRLCNGTVPCFLVVLAVSISDNPFESLIVSKESNGFVRFSKSTGHPSHPERIANVHLLLLLWPLAGAAQDPS
jgi:hypothetical protein